MAWLTFGRICIFYQKLTKPYVGCLFNKLDIFISWEVLTVVKRAARSGKTSYCAYVTVLLTVGRQ